MLWVLHYIYWAISPVLGKYPSYPRFETLLLVLCVVPHLSPDFTTVGSFARGSVAEVCDQVLILLADKTYFPF